MLIKRIIYILSFVIFICPIFVFAGNISIPTEVKQPIKILLVPGHDNEIWGSQYGKIKEADMNLVLATKIYNLFKKDKKFEVFITRDSSGYTKEFADYFSLHQADIISFKEDAKKKMGDKISNGSFVKKENVPHISATSDMSNKLYGINKWANENNIDAVIHIHFNDYPRKNAWTIGKYKGFSIYTPEEQMVNFKESNQLAKNIFSQLHKKYISSTYEKELEGIIPDQSLIALGSNDSLVENTRSILIEYGYIYRFGNSVMRHKAYTNMANLTVAGIKDYFFSK